MSEIVESEENSVLFLQDTSPRVWTLDNTTAANDAPYWICAGVRGLLRQRTKRSATCKFRATTQEETPKYIALVGWTEDRISVRLSSGPCESTRAAFENVCAQVLALPQNDKLDWVSIMSAELGYPGLTRPIFFNKTETGTPAIVCKFAWGPRTSALKVWSEPHKSKIEAFRSAVDQAKRIGPVQNWSAGQGHPSKESTWIEAAYVQTNRKLRRSQIRVGFDSDSEEGKVICTILWGPQRSNTTVSMPMPSREEAFMRALQTVKAELVVLKGPLSKSKPFVRNPQETQSNTTDILEHADAKSRKLAMYATKRWLIEKDWLMERSQLSQKEAERLHELSTFLVMQDSLRCYEIDRFTRDKAIGQFATELKNITKSRHPDAANSRRTNQLVQLARIGALEVGELVVPHRWFRDSCRSHGFDPTSVLEDMVALNWIRRSPSGELTLSTLGVNVLERQVEQALA